MIEVNLFHYIFSMVGIQLLLMLSSINNGAPLKFIFALNIAVPLLTGMLFLPSSMVVWYGEFYLWPGGNLFIPFFSLGALFIVIKNGLDKPLSSVMSNIMLMVAIASFAARDFITMVITLETIGFISIFISIDQARHNSSLKQIQQQLLLKQLHLIPMLLGAGLFFGATETLSFVNFRIVRPELYFPALASMMIYAVAKLGIPPFQFSSSAPFDNSLGYTHTMSTTLIEKIITIALFSIITKQLIPQLSITGQESVTMTLLVIALISSAFLGIVLIKVKNVTSGISYLYRLGIAVVLPLLSVTHNDNMANIIVIYLFAWGIGCSLLELLVYRLQLNNTSINSFARMAQGAPMDWRIPGIIAMISLLALPMTFGFSGRFLVFKKLLEISDIWFLPLVFFQFLGAAFIIRLLLPILATGDEREKWKLDKTAISDTILTWLMVGIIVIGGVTSISIIEMLL